MPLSFAAPRPGPDNIFVGPVFTYRVPDGISQVKRSSAEHTRSARHRAGSRRTKRLRNVRTFTTDRAPYSIFWSGGPILIWRDEVDLTCPRST